MSASPLVTVFGSSACGYNEASYQAGMRLGRLLAEAGARVACGGYGGVMEAVCHGARSGGGLTLGYTVAAWRDKRVPNRYLCQERPCRDLHERLQLLIEPSDALVALGGGIGTIVEVFLAWNQLYMGLIAERPLLVVGQEWARAIAGFGDLFEIRPAHLEHITICDTAEQAVAKLREGGVLK